MKSADAQTVAGAVTGQRKYDAFGAVAYSTGSWTGPWGYAGGWGYRADGDGGLLHVGHRYYDPSIGRFLSRDPIQSGRNWYAYCENDPVNLADPSGNIVETLADVAGIGYDFYQLYHEPTWENSAYTVWSIGSAFVPGVPGSYAGRAAKAARLAAQHADEVADAVRIAKQLEGSAAQVAGRAKRGVRDPGIGGGGGVYELYDLTTGDTVYVGSTNNFGRREKEHARRSSPKSEYGFRAITKEPDKNLRRLLEQKQIDKYGLDNLLNKINAVAKKDFTTKHIGGVRG